MELPLNVGSIKRINSVSVFNTGNMGKHLEAAAKDILATMSEKMTTSEIARVTNVPQRTLQRLLANPYQHRDVQVETRGRHRALTVHEVNVRMQAGQLLCYY